jgi:hypothetical protein
MPSNVDVTLSTRRPSAIRREADKRTARNARPPLGADHRHTAPLDSLGAQDILASFLTRPAVAGLRRRHPSHTIQFQEETLA